MNLRYLEAFLAVAERGSLAGAAQDLKIATSAVSRQIRLFEESVEVSLFDRQTRKLLLTPAGEHLRREARLFAEASTSGLLGFSKRKVRMGCLQSAFEEKIAPSLIKGWARFPHDILVGSPSWLLSELQEDRLDAVITSLSGPASTSIRASKLYDEVPCFVAANSAARIVYEPYKDLWLKEQETWERSIHVNSLNAALELCRAGVGSAILPSVVAKRAGLRNTRSLGQKKIPIYFCTKKLKNPRTDVLEILTELRRHKV